MMLSALYELARREGLLEDPDFERRRVDFYVRFDDHGRFLALVPTADEEGRAQEIAVPRQPKRTVKVVPGFLFDNAKYVLGLGPEGKSNARTKECAASFREQLVACAEATGDQGLQAAARFLGRLDEQRSRILAARPAPEWTGSEWIALVREADGEPVHLRPKARGYWVARRKESGGRDGAVVRCLVTGAIGEAALTHPNVKRVPQAQTSGAALVSFNCSAFESHGLSQGENAPVSRAAAEGYVTALNWLLEGSPARPHRYGVRLGDDAVTAFWTREKNEVADYLASMLEASPEDYARLVEAPFRGLAPEATDDTAFYAVTLSGNAARVVVRDWFETTAGEVKRSLDRYFGDLHLGNGPVRPAPIWALLKAVQAPSGRGLSPGAAGKLLSAALRGGPFPREVLAAALRRLRLPPDEKEGADRLRLRCALVKASLVRLPRSGTRREVPVSLDETKMEVPYLLGRLFAILERLQGAAQGDINATIRDRWFGAASTTPVLAFPRLLRLSVHHAAKAERGGWLEKLKGQVVAALPAEPFPRALSLEDQGLFAVGYYHQREKFFEKRAVEASAPPAA